MGLAPIYPEYFATTAKKMAAKPCRMVAEKIEYMTDMGIPIGEFGITGKRFKPVVTVDSKDPVPTRAKSEPEDHFWFADQLPRFKIHRYRKKLNELKSKKTKKYSFFSSKNLDKFVQNLVEALMNLPMKGNVGLDVKDVKHFLKIIQPSLFGEASTKKNYPRAAMSAGEYVANLQKTHVRIVGETRGDFDALRRAINIPSGVGGENHPLMQYNWVFLGNYTGRHPQSLETLMFLLALQFLYGRDCIVLLRGVMEFEDTSEEYGFKDNLMTRFGRKGGLKVWGMLMEVVSKLPLNSQVLYGIYCSYGGFNDADAEGKDKDARPGVYHTKTTRQALAKIFSLPNVTVRDYLENADTGAGYYYGERVLQKIAASTHMYTFFSTAPMMGGVGFFSDSSAAQLITISSVRHLHGHGGQKSLLAAVAEIDGDTNLITMHMILHEDEMFHYDQETEELCYGLTKGEKPARTKTTEETGKTPTETTPKTNTATSKESAPTSTVTKSTTKLSKENAAKPKGIAKPGAKAKIVSSSNSKTKTASAEV